MSEEEKPEEEKPITIEATLMPLDRPLASGTIYPREVVEEAVKRLQGPISVKRVLGEFDPREIGPNVHLEDASHTLVKLEVGGDNELIGTVELMKTPAGLELRDFLLKGNAVRLAPRGLGHRGEDGKVSDYTLVCVDIVPVERDEDEMEPEEAVDDNPFSEEKC
jgi:hypothetical protein